MSDQPPLPPDDPYAPPGTDQPVPVSDVSIVVAVLAGACGLGLLISGGLCSALAVMVFWQDPGGDLIGLVSGFFGLLFLAFGIPLLRFARGRFRRKAADGRV